MGHGDRHGHDIHTPAPAAEPFATPAAKPGATSEPLATAASAAEPPAAEPPFAAPEAASSAVAAAAPAAPASYRRRPHKSDSRSVYVHRRVCIGGERLLRGKHHAQQRHVCERGISRRVFMGVLLIYFIYFIDTFYLFY